jgi:hypothetical protein
VGMGCGGGWKEEEVSELFEMSGSCVGIGVVDISNSSLKRTSNSNTARFKFPGFCLFILVKEFFRSIQDQE